MVVEQTLPRREAVVYRTVVRMPSLGGSEHIHGMIGGVPALVAVIDKGRDDTRASSRWNSRYVVIANPVVCHAVVVEHFRHFADAVRYAETFAQPASLEERRQVWGEAYRDHAAGYGFHPGTYLFLAAAQWEQRITHEQGM